MYYFKFVSLLVFMISITLTSAMASPGKIDELLTKKTDITQEEKAEIKLAYDAAQKEGLYPDMIQNVVSEGFSKRYNVRPIINAANRKLEQVRQVKKFCYDTSSRRLKIEYSFQNTELFIVALGNKISWEEMKASYEAADLNGYTSKDYIELLKAQSALARRNVPGEYVMRMLSKAGEQKIPFNYVKKLMKIVEENTDGLSREAVLDAISQNMNLFEIENAIQNRYGVENYGKTGEIKEGDVEVGENIRRGRISEEKGGGEIKGRMRK
jgi:hypothetical protein